MENIVPKKKSAVLFDLKGSSIDRLIENIDYNNLPLGTVLKDENFRICGLKIEIPEEVAEEIIDVLKGDFEMLKSQNIMDYSILLACYSKTHEFD